MCATVVDPATIMLENEEMPSEVRIDDKAPLKRFCIRQLHK